MTQTSLYKLGDICRVINGRAYKQTELLDSGTYRVLRVGNFFSNSSWYYSSLELEEDKYCHPGDLLFAWSASFGPRIWKDIKTIYHYHIWKLEPNRELLDKVYLYYYLQNKTKSMLGSTHGSIMLHITKAYMENLPVFIPRLSEQQKIASVLSALDNKIELNNKINAELEQMAKTIYDYWFVQFDFPDANGKPYKSSGGKMVWNEELKREVPEGWEVKMLGDYAKIKKGTLITEKSADTTGSIKVISAGIGFSYYHSESNFSENTITISASGANAGFVNFWREPIFACDCTTVRGNNTADTLQILFFLQSRQEFIYSQARGSAQPHVYPKDIEQLTICIPPKEVIKKYGSLVVPANSCIEINLKQNQQLSQLRDWLLPMLMNGQVTVGRAYEQVQEVLGMAADGGVAYGKKRHE